MARRLATAGGLLLSAALALTTTLATTAPAQAALPSKAMWKVDVHTAMTGSNHWLDARLKEGGTGLAINLDIDNTSLASHYAPGHAVPWVRHFTRHAYSHDLAILFNTGRLQGDGRLDKVAGQLRAAGYHVTEVCGRHTGERLVQGKQRCRQHFVDEGYTLIANIGNRATDFTGGNYERGFKLPDYDKQLS
jgi:hypothetical protein